MTRNVFIFVAIVVVTLVAGWYSDLIDKRNSIDLQTILAIAAFIIAYIELKKWREELLGRKRIEVVIELGKIALKIKQEFISLREVPFNQDGLEKDIEHNMGDYIKRMMYIKQEIKKLRELSWEVEVLFKGNVNQQVQGYASKVDEYDWALQEIGVTGVNARDTDRIVYSDPNNSDDPFQKDIDRITEEILKFARQHIR